MALVFSDQRRLLFLLYIRITHYRVINPWVTTTGSCLRDVDFQEDPDTVTNRADLAPDQISGSQTEMNYESRWIQGKLHRQEGQVINNLPCRGSLQITDPPLHLLVYCHSSFFLLLSVTSLFHLLFPALFFQICLSFLVAWLSRQTDPRGGLGVEGKRVFIYSPPPSSLLRALTRIFTVGGGKYLKRRHDGTQPL